MAFTNADVQRVINQAFSLGREVDEWDGATYLRALEILRENPHDVASLSIVESMTKFLETGEENRNFYRFAIGSCDTQQENEEKERRAMTYRNATAAKGATD